MKDLKFASENDAIQYLANVTGKKIICSDFDRFKPLYPIRSKEEIRKYTQNTAKEITKDEANKSDLLYTELGILTAQYGTLYDEYQRLLKRAKDLEKEFEDLEKELEE